jgi:hypothetical protein
MADSTAEEKLEQLLKDLDLPTVSSTASSSSSTITSTELDLVSSSLIAGDDGDTPSSKSKRARSLAFLVLARLLQPKEGSAGDSSSPNIASIGSYIKTQLEETDLEPLIRSLATLSAVFQIDPTAGAQILQTDGVAQGLADAIELEGLSNSNKQPTKEQALDQARLAYVLAETFSNGLNAAACRPVIRNLASDWLNRQARRDVPKDGPEPLRSLRRRTVVVASVALTKLLRAESADPLINPTTAGNTGTAGREQDDDESQRQTSKRKGEMNREMQDLTSLFSQAVISSAASTPATDDLDINAIGSSLEGLAYTSSQPSVKAKLCQDTAFIKALFALAARLSKPQSKPKPAGERKTGLSASYALDAELDRPEGGPRESSSLAYGIGTILLNLLSRRPTLTAEQRQVEKLKQLASAGKAQQKMGQTVEESKEEDERIDSNEAVEARVRWAMGNGLIGCLIDLGKSDSARVKVLTGKLYLEVSTDAGTRPELVRDGGFKSLLQLVSSLLPEIKPRAKPEGNKALTGPTEGVPVEALPAIQALSKMLITLLPQTLFGVNPASNALDTIRPLSMLLLHDSSTLLQKFEAMMALTNLASIGPEVATRIFSINDSEIIKQAEHLMLEDHELVRRAAVELVCNLLASDEGFCRYSGDTPDSSSPSHTDREKGGTSEGATFSRLHVLLAMTNVCDLNTRLAASGALATLTQSPTACRILLAKEDRQKKVFSMIFDMLSPPVLRSDNDDEGDEDVEEVTTLEPDTGLIFRAMIFLANLLGFASSDASGQKSVIMSTADQQGVPKRLLWLLAKWTSPSSSSHPGKEVADATIECLRLFKAAGIKLTM